MTDMEGSTEGGRATDWQFRARLNDNRPDPVDVVPDTLHQLGEVFFPIPRGEKGYNYPHHMQEFRYTADSETLNAYLEAGWGYGISCAGDIAVIDIDNLNFVDEISSELPETAWQLSGSREGVHLFYMVENLDTRQMLYTEFMDEWVHIGEVKCDPHGYVIGPGSVHPSGNTYGPLNGNDIATISREELMDAIEPYQKPVEEKSTSVNWDDVDHDIESDFYSLTADDVLPWLGQQERIAHPVHGSSTGMNFMKNEDGETFTCWRCQYGGGEGCGLNGVQFLAAEATGMDCEDVRRNWQSDDRLHYKAWVRAYKQGLVGCKEIPYAVIKGYGESLDIVDGDEKLYGDLYHDLLNGLRYEAFLMDVTTP